MCFNGVLADEGGWHEPREVRDLLRAGRRPQPRVCRYRGLRPPDQWPDLVARAAATDHIRYFWCCLAAEVRCFVIWIGGSAVVR